MSDNDSEYSDINSQDEQEEIEDLTNEAVVTKYRMASDIVNAALKAVAGAVAAGKNVVELCELGDATITKGVAGVFQKAKEVEKGIAFPTCISINNVVGHFSPLKSDTTVVIQDGDVVKIDLGVHVDGFIATGAHTVVAGTTEVTGTKADAVAAAHFAAEAVHRLLRPGHKASEITAVVEKIATAFGVQAVEGVLSHNMKRWVIDGNKAWPNKHNVEYKFEDFEIEDAEVYGVDLVFSTGEGKPKEREQRTTVFKRRPETTYMLKMKASRQVLTEINKAYPTTLFSLRSLSDEKVARMGIVECLSHDLVSPYPVLFEKDGDFVVQLKFTAAIQPGATHRLTGLPVVAHKTDKTITDEEIVALLKTSVKKGKAKKKAAAAKKAEEATEKK